MAVSHLKKINYRALLQRIKVENCTVVWARTPVTRSKLDKILQLGLILFLEIAETNVRNLWILICTWSFLYRFWSLCDNRQLGKIFWTLLPGQHSPKSLGCPIWSTHYIHWFICYCQSVRWYTSTLSHYMFITLAEAELALQAVTTPCLVKWTVGIVITCLTAPVQHYIEQHMYIEAMQT